MRGIEKEILEEIGRRRRALLIHSGALGDFILTLRWIAGLRRDGWIVDLLGRPEYGDLAQRAGLVRRVWNVETSGLHLLHAGGADPGGAPREILSGHDLIIHVSASERRIELDEAIARSAGCCVVGYDPRPRADWGGHITAQWKMDLEAEGLKIEPDLELLHGLAASLESESARANWKTGCLRVVVHPGSGAARKNWPLGSFLRVADKLTRKRNADVRFLLGPVELETWSADDLDQLRNSARLLEGLALMDATALIAGADLFIGNDSGMSHLAAALGKNVVAVFCGTSPDLWKPLGGNVAVCDGEASSETENVLIDMASRCGKG